MKRLLPSSTGVRPNQWIYFEDLNGAGYAQPDLFILFKRRVLLFEIKLTETLAGHAQLEGLYSPLLSFIFSRPVTKVLVCKNLRRGIKKRIEIDSLVGASQSQSDSILTWQWLP